MKRLGSFLLSTFGLVLVLHFLSVLLIYRKLSLHEELTSSSSSSSDPTSRNTLLRQQSTNLPKTVSSSTSYVFNSWTQERYLCGHEIPPNSTIEIDTEDCTDDVGRVFPTLPSVSGGKQHVPPIVVRFQDKKKKNQLKNVSSCDIPCQVWPTGTPSTRDPATIDGTPFQFVAYSMEGSGIYKTLEVKPMDFLKYKYYATTSMKSEVPLSYYDESLYNIQHPSVEYEKAIKGSSFMARNCNSLSGRENLLKELIQHASSTSFKIDSLSSCMRNALPPKGVNMDNKTDVMKEYLFHFSFENQRTPDYITEKLWGALASGTLPVYLGAPNIKDHVPPRSIILVDDFSSAKELVDYLIKVANNKTLYNSYHEWRRKPSPIFEEKYNFTRVHSYCRVCRFSYAMKYGWSWDWKNQQVQQLNLPRRVCRDENGMISSPMKESWILNDSTPPEAAIIRSIDDDDIDNNNECNNERKTMIEVPGTNWKRTISNHDYVTDIEINRLDHKKQEEVIFRLGMPINTTQVLASDRKDSYKQRVYWVENNVSRIIIVFNEAIVLPEQLKYPGILDVPINKPIRIRLIVEDIDTFHDDGKTIRPNGFLQESYYASLMIDEFFHPLKFSTKEITTLIS